MCPFCPWHVLSLAWLPRRCQAPKSGTNLHPWTNLGTLSKHQLTLDIHVEDFSRHQSIVLCCLHIDMTHLSSVDGSSWNPVTIFPIQLVRFRTSVLFWIVKSLVENRTRFWRLIRHIVCQPVRRNAGQVLVQEVNFRRIQETICCGRTDARYWRKGLAVQEQKEWEDR